MIWWMWMLEEDDSLAWVGNVLLLEDFSNDQEDKDSFGKRKRVYSFGKWY